MVSSGQVYMTWLHVVCSEKFRMHSDEVLCASLPIKIAYICAFEPFESFPVALVESESTRCEKGRNHRRWARKTASGVPYNARQQGLLALESTKSQDNRTEALLSDVGLGSEGGD
jgi:hypothetical protein